MQRSGVLFTLAGRPWARHVLNSSLRHRSPALRPAMQDPHAAEVVSGHAEADAREEGGVQGDVGGSRVASCNMVVAARGEDVAAVRGGHGEEHRRESMVEVRNGLDFDGVAGLWVGSCLWSQRATGNLNIGVYEQPDLPPSKTLEVDRLAERTRTSRLEKVAQRAN